MSFIAALETQKYWGENLDWVNHETEDKFSNFYCKH